MEIKKKDFSFVQAISFGAKTFYDNIGVFALSGIINVALIASAVAAVAVFLSKEFVFALYFSNRVQLASAIGKITAGNVAFTLIVLLALFAIAIGFGLGAIKVAINLYKKNEFEYSDLFSCFKLVPKVLVVISLFLLVSIICMIPALFLPKVIGIFLIIAIIVISFLLFVRYGFAQFALVDKNIGLLDMLKISSKVLQGVFLKILLIVVFVGLFYQVLRFVLPGGATVFWTLYIFILLPIQSLTYVFIYFELLEQTKLK